MEHNHKVSAEYNARIPQNRKLDDLQTDYVKPLVHQDISVKTLHNIAQERFNEPITVKDMANLVHRERKNAAGFDISALEKNYY